jgi:hypothetical protein
MASLRLLAGFGNLISGLRMASLADHNRHWLWLSGFGWSISAATDLMIAATLVFHLHQQRKKVDKRSVRILILLTRIRNYCSFLVALELRCWWINSFYGL